MANYDLGTIGYTIEARGGAEAERQISSIAQKLVAAQRQYSTLDKAFNTNLISAQQYAKGVQQVDSRIEQLTASIDQQTTAVTRQSAYMQQSHKSINRFGMVAQQVGYQVGDFFVQVQSGTNALVAFGQQGTQLAGLLPGVWGAVFGIGISMATMLGAAIMRTEADLEGFSGILGTLGPMAEAIGVSFQAMGTAIVDGLNVVINNLDRLIIYGLTAATVFGVRWVSAMVAAAAATGSLSGALVVFRSALIRTGIGAIIVAAGELVYQFTRLVHGAGSFGEALDILGQIAKDVFSKIVQTAYFAAEMIGDSWIIIEAGWLKVLGNMQSAWGQFLRVVSGGLLVIPGLSGLGADLAMKAGLAGQGADETLATASNLSATYKALGESVQSSLTNIWDTPSEGMNRMREAMAKADELGSKIDIRDWFTGGDGEDGSGGGGGGGKGKKAKDILTEMQEKFQSLADTIQQSFSDAFMSMVDGTKTVGQAFKDMAREIIKQLFDILVVQQIVGSWDAKTGAGTGITGLLMGGFTKVLGGSLSTGGSMVAGKPYLVGEKGPEIVVPRHSGTVKNAQESVGMLGGSGSITVNTNISVVGSDKDSVRREIQKMIPQITEATKASVINARQRGGAMKSAFQ